MVIEMNKILKRNTSNEDDTRYNARGFKVVPNIMGIVNVIKTSEPKDVEKDIDELLTDYLKLKKVTLEDIIDFHFKFEKIYSFGDGNGCVGRMIMFKECLLFHLLF